MQQVVDHERNKIEFALSGRLTEEDVRQIVRQLESLCAAQQKVRVLFDAVELEHQDLQVALGGYAFFREYHDRVERIAVVSGRDFYDWMVRLMNRLTEVEIRSFPVERMYEARDWVWR